MKKISAFIFCFFTLSALYAQSPAEELLPHELIEDSMLLCGLEKSDENYLKALEKYKSLEKELNEVYLKDKNFSEKEKAEAVLTFMYEKVLYAYQINQSFIDKTFDSGIYNCVSSSIIYVALAKSAELDARAQLTKDHCFVTYYSSDLALEKVDVETTNPYGFNPGVKKNISSSENSSRYVTVPKKYYSNRKEISLKHLATLPSRNLMSYYTESSKDIEAIELAERNMKYLEDSGKNEKEEALKDYILCTRNHAVSLNRKKLFDESLSVLEKLMDDYGKTSSLLKDYDDFFHNGLVFYFNERDFEGGKDFINRHKAKYLSEQSFTKAESMMIAGSCELLFDQILNGKNNEYSLLSAKEKYLLAAQKALEFFNQYPYVKELKKYSDTFYNNYAVCVHNEFASYANNGDYEKAGEVLEEGLKNYPASNNLKKDLKSLERVRRK